MTACWQPYYEMKVVGCLVTLLPLVFFALSFWNQVVVFTNEYAEASGSPSRRSVDLDNLMKFLGILWYMALLDRGDETLLAL